MPGPSRPSSFRSRALLDEAPSAQTAAGVHRSKKSRRDDRGPGPARARREKRKFQVVERLAEALRGARRGRADAPGQIPHEMTAGTSLVNFFAARLSSSSSQTQYGTPASIHAFSRVGSVRCWNGRPCGRLTIDPRRLFRGSRRRRGPAAQILCRRRLSRRAFRRGVEGRLLARRWRARPALARPSQVCRSNAPSTRRRAAAAYDEDSFWRESVALHQCECYECHGGAGMHVSARCCACCAVSA